MKRPGRDQRQGDDDEEQDSAAERFRVDRVFAPVRRASTSPPTVLGSSRPASDHPEFALRQQISRLQRQFADAQRELANKEDELSVELEHRMLITAARDKLLDDQRRLENRVDDLQQYQARTVGIEQRLGDSVSYVKELAHSLDHERALRGAAEARVAELLESIEATRGRRIDDRAQIDEQHTAELERLEAQHHEALASSEATLRATAARLRDDHEVELAALRAAHERSLAALRGELEPKLLEARSHAEERERLASEVVALRAAAERGAVERDEAHRREIARLVDHQAAETAAHARELSRACGERDVEILEHQKTIREAELRDQLWNQTTGALRETQKKLQLEVSEAHKSRAVAEAAKLGLEQSIAAATATNERLVEELRASREQLDAFEDEARHVALERQRLVACLQDGLSLLGVPVVGPPELPELPELPPEP